jgi:putative transposase
VRWSRPLEGTPKTVTISREADGYYVCFSCAELSSHPLPATGQETGIDLGLEPFATLSDGTMIHNPRCYRKAERALKTAQRRVSRRKKGSNRRRTAVQLLAKAHLKVKRQRQDFHHKTALALVRTHDTIYHEDLQTANMVTNHHLAKSISDAGWSAFLAVLSAKAAWAGRRVVAVPPAYTSQACSGCGVTVAKGLSVRWHRCPDCGTSLHRDQNAARNIERAGQAFGERWRRPPRRAENPRRFSSGGVSTGVWLFPWAILLGKGELAPLALRVSVKASAEPLRC